MLSSNQVTRSSEVDNNFIEIFNAALVEYHKVTGLHLDTHPFGTRLDTCQSPELVSDLLQAQAQAFSRFCDGDKKLMAWLDPTVHILYILSSTLGEGIGLPFSPAKAIFTGIGVLLGAVRDEIASYETLIDLFERLHFFLQRLNSYTRMPLTNSMTKLLGKIMAQLLSVLALSTRVMRDSRIRSFARRLAGRTDIESAVLRLDGLTKEENLMMAVRNLEVTHDVDRLVRNVDGNIETTKAVTQIIDGNVKATKELVHDVDHNVKATKNSIYEFKRNQLRQEFRAWLSPPDPSFNHNTAREAHHRGTASWFIQSSTFQDWKKRGSLLWIRGNPGAGKTILCSAIVEDIKKMRQAESESCLIAYYYFDFKEASKRDLRGLLASLVLQLSDDSDSCWEILHDLYTACHEGSEKPSNSTLSESLKSMLEAPGQDAIFLILDALDECPSTHGTPSAREKVLDFVEGIVGSYHPNLFICITSRPEQDIQTVLNPLTSPSLCISLHDEVGQREDIVNYIRSFVHQDRSMRRWREEDRELVITSLSKRAYGMFRWVVCQLDTLRRCMPSSIRKALDELPITLYETYERILQEIPREKKKHTRRLFQCLISSVRPLRVEELGEILTINFDTNTTPNLVEGWRPEHPEEEILCACSTLIAVVDDGDFRIVQFSHFSVKEFLISDALQTSEIESIRHYYIPLDAAHTVLVRACLTVLLQLDETIDKNRLTMFPLASYAAQHWVDHAKVKDVALQFTDAMERLFNPKKPYLASWAWIYDIDSPWVPQSIDALADVPSPPTVTALYYAALCGFAGLAKHLIIMHEDVNAKCGRHGTPLHVAAHMGHVDAARVLLDHGADMDINVFGESPLGSAYLTEHLDVMQLLLECGANPEVKHDDGWLLSHSASFHGKIDVMRLLLFHNASVNPKDKRKRTPLHCASIGGHGELVRFLLEHGADVNARDDKNSTPLRWAATGGNAEVVKHLLMHGADVDAIDYTNSTPLHWASTDGHVEVVKLLLEHGADVNVRDGSNSTPLRWASANGHVELVELLLKQGADVDARHDTNMTPLHWASRDGYAEVVKLLLKYGADVNAKDNLSSTPLQWASRGGHAEVVRLLLEHGAEVNTTDDTNSTPFYWACEGGNVELIELLLKHGADVDVRNNSNSMPLHQASRIGNVKAVKLLLEHGANVNIRDSTTLTSLQYAIRDGHLGIIRPLLEYGADVNARDDTNSTSMHWASRDGFLEAIELLLQYQADVNARDDTNLTPLHWASRYGHLELVDLLLEHDADVNACSMVHGTPLCLASGEGHLEVVRLLLAYGADVHIRGEHDLTAFQTATVYEQIEVAELLLEYGAERD